METEVHKSSTVPHILLTSLGKNAFPTKYEWGHNKVTASLAPLALIEFLKKLGLPMPDSVLAVVTKEAKSETWPTFQSGICDIPDFNPVEVKDIDIPNGVDNSEIGEILESVAQHIPAGAKLTLDVTHGLRHFPFIFYALVLYLKSLRRVEILGAYYGMVDAGESKPIIDLQPLLELPEWFYAVRMFRDQGTTKPMADLLAPLAGELKKEGDKLRNGAKKSPEEAVARYKQGNEVKNANNWLERYAFAYESALPLELEKASKGLVDSINRLPTIDSQRLPPLAEELTESIINTAGETAFTKSPSSKGKWKKRIPLDKDELKRQAYMVDVYLERGQLSLAVGLMREWVVSWAIWKSANCKDIKNWLDSDVRGEYEDSLGAIGAVAKGASATPKLKLSVPAGLGNFWNQLTTELRNALLHNAMRIDHIEEPPTSLQSVQCFWNTLKLV